MAIDTVNQERHVPLILSVTHMETMRVQDDAVDAFGISFRFRLPNGSEHSMPPLAMPRHAFVALRKMIDQTLIDFPAPIEQKEVNPNGN